ncbi:hypothetical protein ZOSMA_166G00750 [Zostera marina]|uniref:Uncharacterized protein n=1 Tax=Zostera marina TaxID=29655 RepID=A0A0K9PTT4_ZOSMR|nr:hypothetical protein ZOSMA_166G00750 [Zostera marina]
MWIDKTVQIFSREAKGVVYSLNACNGKLLVAFNQKIQLNKIGRDSLYYVEPLIESIMGGLEGLINILDSDSGFVSLEMQLHPDQAVIRMIQASKVSTSFVKSTKGVYGLPGYESCRSGNISVKVLEAATQRLTSLCSVLNDMEPIRVLNHVFVLREYMRDCFLANFRKRLLMVLRIENCLQRPSVVESLIRRHIRIIHLAEQHISMDLTEGIRDILLSEIFLGPVSSLQQNVNIADQNSGSALEIVCNWYIENIVKDTIGADVYFVPFHNCFKHMVSRALRLLKVGHALTFRRLLVESAKAILEEKAPLFVSLLSGVVKQLSDEISEKDEIKRLRTVANDIGVIEDHDTECIYLTMSKVGLSDSSWSPFPCLCAAFMASNIWNTASYDVNISGFNDNIHCLARCISSVIAGSELAILERNEQGRRSLPKDHVGENLNSEVNFVAEYHKALSWFEMTLSHIPSSLGEMLEPTLVNHAHTLRKLGKYKEAIHYYEKALAISTRSCSTYAGLAYTYHLQDNFDSAITYYHKALWLNPDDQFCTEMLTLALTDEANGGKFLKDMTH